MNKQIAFEYIVSKLIEWQNERHISLSTLTRVKALKLLFLISAVDVGGKDLLDVFDNFVAMQHGPVEQDIYYMMGMDKFDKYSFKDICISIKDGEFVIDEEIKNRIDSSFDVLMSISPMLIQQQAFELVDLTHKWDCWNLSYQMAQILDKGSYPISTEQIRCSNKVYK